MAVRPALAWLRRSSDWTSRVLLWTLLCATLIFASVVLALRYWFLPNIETYRNEIANAVSHVARARITIGHISGEWDGMRPYLKLEKVSVYDSTGARALELDRVDSTIAWRSLLTFRPHFQSLVIYSPVLEVRRDASGVLFVARIPIDSAGPDAGFSDWLLEQPHVEVHEADITWIDEVRRAPPLRLTRVSAHLANRGQRHRFGLRATPPSELAGPIDLRGDLRGNRVEFLSQWNGKFFVELERVELGAWSPWLHIPAEITRGSGSLRSWLSFDQHQLTSVVADVGLSSVRARLREDLPQLELDRLAGRISWRSVENGFEASAERLGLAGSGVVLAPADIQVRIRNGAAQGGELKADAFDLAPLVVLADRLPLDQALRADLVALSPRGRVNDLHLKWQGVWPNLASYGVRGRFQAVAFNAAAKMPGVTGLTGNVDATDTGGTLHVTGKQASLNLPDVFPAPLALDTLTGQLAWTRAKDGTRVRFNNVAFANADAAGSFFGTYHSALQGAGDIDLTGHITRAEAARASHYIPVTLLRASRPWFERAFVAGRSNDVRFKVKGKLDDFPYPQDKHGVFEVTAKISGGILDYAERWPRIENIEGNLRFHGSRMEFHAKQGTIDRVRLSNVQGQIGDFKAAPEVLTITGEAAGATPDFLAFVAKSPLGDKTDRLADEVRAQGAGRLELKLTLPLGQMTSTTVAGTYHFTGNQISFGRGLPPLEQASGRLEFTESSLRAARMNGILLGGPVTITAATQRDATLRATLNGRVNADNVRKAGGPAWMQHLSGSTDWRGTVSVRNKVPDVLIESSLQGISSRLPAPFAKSPAQTVPLRIERRATNSQSDRLSFRYGDAVNGELVRRTRGEQTFIDRGLISFGPAAAGEPERPGIWIRGALNKVDFDEWLAFNRDGASDGESSYSVAGADIRLNEVDFFGRRFNDVAVTMRRQNAGTELTLDGREIAGAATWRGEGRGRLIARLKKLTLASADPASAVPVVSVQNDKPRELPALDVIVEQFQHGEKQLGRLEVQAVHQERDWRIEKLRLVNPDTVLSAEGVWQSWRTHPRTQVNVQMEAKDIGKALTRWGYPPGIRRGAAKISGLLSWAGSPPDFDYPTLSGNLSVEATNGQFVKLEPGIGKLLGILSLQSLPRRISLDFRDVFSQGFSFDSIAGAVKIERGVANTDKFRVQGPSAHIVMSGSVDLARETQKLHVRVMPHVSDSVSIAGALIGGPVAGVATYLAQKILKDPIERLIAFEYNVSGGWSDPEVRKVPRRLLPMSEAER